MSATYKLAGERPYRARIIRIEGVVQGLRAATLRRALEQHPQALLIRLVTEAGGKATKIAGEAGTPDVFLKMLEFPSMLVEMKRDGEAPEAHQEIRRLEWEAVGVPTTWCAGAADVYAFMKIFR